ncbi:MAG TPA: hypothetical protein VLT36_14365 [Candidatus Dormibacteraeota bacterium]|nr:hypothetical protein [Candidatus Dormibacteraeota bacterium]
MKRIADTGLLKAALDASDTYHEWGSREFQNNAPFHVCEGVLVELAHLLGDASAGVRMLARGDLILDFNLAENVDEVLVLLEKYSDREMDLVDGCIVRMSELNDQCKVWTVDHEDFRVYRRHGRQTIACEFPRSYVSRHGPSCSRV